MRYELLFTKSNSEAQGNDENLDTEEMEETDTTSSESATEYLNVFDYYLKRPRELIIVFGALIAISLLVYVNKSKKYAEIKKALQEFAWAGDSWDPPKLIRGTFQISGKINKELHPVETTLLLEFTLPQITAIMIEGLQKQGIIDIVKKNPLTIKIISDKRAGSEYEEKFLASFNTKGEVLSGLLADFYEIVIK